MREPTVLPRRRRSVIGVEMMLLAAGAGFGAPEARAATLLQEVPRTATLPGVADAPYPYASPAEVGLDDARLSALVDLAAGWVADDRIVGAEMLIVKDRKIVLHETVGWSDREAGVPLERNSIYRLRSMTKPFTGTAALMLVDGGLLDLNAPVGTHLPSWNNGKSGAITIHQLLSHTSGFTQGGWPVPAQSFSDLRTIVDLIGTAGPQHPPGEQFIYSDADSFALGSLVTELSGIPVEDFIQTRILTPLELEDTYLGYQAGAGPRERWNPTYARDEDGPWEKYWEPGDALTFSYFRASGGMFSTAFDYATWLDVWMDGTRLPTPPLIGANRLLRQSTVDRALTWSGGDELGGYGYHWELASEDPLVFGHGGSDGTMAYAVPSENLMILFFTQSRGTTTLREWREAALASIGG
jgi:CubicO group peptidase (beta-lactamase class C family)